jgi:hypothetical protein
MAESTREANFFLGASVPQRSPTRNLGRPSLSTLFNPATRQTAHSSITALSRILGNCPSFFFLFDLTQREWHNARGIIISVWVPSRFKPTVRLLTPGLYLVHSPPDSWSILSHLCPVDSTNFTGTSRCVWRHDRRDGPGTSVPDQPHNSCCPGPEHGNRSRHDVGPGTGIATGTPASGGLESFP